MITVLMMIFTILLMITVITVMFTVITMMITIMLITLVYLLLPLFTVIKVLIKLVYHLFLLINSDFYNNIVDKACLTGLLDVANSKNYSSVTESKNVATVLAKVTTQTSENSDKHYGAKDPCVSFVANCDFHAGEPKRAKMDKNVDTACLPNVIN